MATLGASAILITLAGVGMAPAPAHGELNAAGRAVSFRTPVDFATGAIPSSAAFNVAAGDQLPLQLAHATLSDSVAVGDFNGDGKPDAAQTNVIAGSLSVFLGDGAGGFGSPHTQPVGVHPNFVVAGDLDLDGHLDLVVANSGSNDVAVLLGDGSGNFQPAAFVPVPAPRNVAIGDFNGDDVPDLAVATGGPAAGCPAACATLPEAGGTAIFRGASDEHLRVVYQPSQFIRHTHSASGQAVRANHVAVDDFDGNGLDDLAVAVGNNRSAGDQPTTGGQLTGDDLLVFLNRDEPDGEPFNEAANQPAIRVGASPDAIAVGDWNGDAHPDLAVLGNGSGDVTTLLGDSNGHFVLKARNATVGAIPRSLAVGDFNNDGVADLVTASFGASTVSVLQGNSDGLGHGNGTFQPAVDFWSGDAPTGVAVGHFDDDGRPDVLVGRLRTDQLSVLLNDSPKRGDGVVIKRDISYGSPTHPTDDPFAAHHTLDVYVPKPGTPSFAGPGQRYPVVFFAHGGGGISGDKTMVSYLMRSLAVDGIVAVSTNYRLGAGLAEAQVKDVAQAFRWTRDNVGSRAYGGDPDNLFVFGHSAGAGAAAKVATDPLYAAEQQSMRGIVLAANGAVEDAVRLRVPSLVVSGSEGLDSTAAPAAAVYAAAASAAGGDSKYEMVLGRDHLTVISRMALANDEGRGHVLSFLRGHLRLGGRVPVLAGSG